MITYRYELDKSSNKFICPECNKKKFVKYIDTETGEYLPEQYGKCDRIEKCKYSRNPYKNGYLKDTYKVYKNVKHDNAPRPQPKPISFIKPEILIQSKNKYESNNFIIWLKTKFGDEIVNNLIETYNIGTSNNFNGGSVVFWQIDINGMIRTGKIMQYNSTTGKRIKEPSNLISWVHNILKLPNYNLKQCLYGVHLIKGNNKPIAIVESEKTAIISSVYFPNYIWIATGGSNINKEATKVLSGRNVYLFPDLSKYGEWCKIANELPINIKVFDLLERNASDTDKKEGYDLADYLIKFDYRKFRERMEIAEKNEVVESNKAMERMSDGDQEGEVEKEDIPTLILLNRKCNTSPESSTHKTAELFNTNRTYASEVQKTNIEKTKTVFVNKEGKLFIETPLADTYSIYPSVEHYNQRKCYPYFEKRNSIDVSQFQKIHIDLETLTINLN